VNCILVTGGAGFIGSHFIERLLEQTSARVVCLDDFNDYYSPALKRLNTQGFAHHERVRIVEGSFCNMALLQSLFSEERFSHVAHLGAYAGVRASVAKPQIFEQSNFQGTLELLEAVRKFPVERFVLASSSTVYGQGATAPFVEDALLGTPLSPYGVTKRSAELMALTYHQLHQVPVVILRPFSIYGPRLRPDLALSIFAAAILKGTPLPLFGDGAARRDFTHVDDMCRAIHTALTAEAAVGQAINVGNDRPVTIRTVIEELETQLGKPALIDRQPPKPGDMDITHADLTKARQLLDYEPRIEFRRGLATFVEWFRQTHG
jgi:UDP-glucuronate 4-epimerase